MGNPGFFIDIPPGQSQKITRIIPSENLLTPGTIKKLNKDLKFNPETFKEVEIDKKVIRRHLKCPKVVKFLKKKDKNSNVLRKKLYDKLLDLYLNDEILIIKTLKRFPDFKWQLLDNFCFITNEQVIEAICKEEEREHLYFISCVGHNHIEACRILLEVEPTLLNQRRSDGRTPILQAVLTGSFAVIKFLITQGANVSEVYNEVNLLTELISRVYNTYKYQSQQVNEAAFMSTVCALIKVGADIEDATILEPQDFSRAFCKLHAIVINKANEQIALADAENNLNTNTRVFYSRPPLI